MINTKYDGIIFENDVLKYCDILIGKIFKMLPIRESDEKNFKIIHNSLMRELLAGEDIILNCGLYIELINKLETLPNLPHKSFTKSEFQKTIMECIDVVEKIRKNLEEGNIFG